MVLPRCQTSRGQIPHQKRYKTVRRPTKMPIKTLNARHSSKQLRKLNAGPSSRPRKTLSGRPSSKRRRRPNVVLNNKTLSARPNSKPVRMPNVVRNSKLHKTPSGKLSSWPLRNSRREKPHNPSKKNAANPAYPPARQINFVSLVRLSIATLGWDRAVTSSFVTDTRGETLLHGHESAARVRRLASAYVSRTGRRPRTTSSASSAVECFIGKSIPQLISRPTVCPNFSIRRGFQIKTIQSEAQVHQFLSKWLQ